MPLFFRSRPVSITTLFCFGLGMFPFAVIAQTFPDMDDSWFRYRDAAMELAEHGTLEGNPDGTFRPKDPINRAEFLTIVFRGRSDSKPVGGDCFEDVKVDAWYAPFSDGGNTVVWCPHEIDRDKRGNYYPHLWPEGTGKEIVEFFEELQ